MAGTGQLRGRMFCEDENVLLLMGPLKQAMGGGQGGGGDLSVSFDLLSLVSVGAGSSGLGPVGAVHYNEVRSGSLLWRS